MSPHPAPPQARVVFLDLARCLAIVLMVFAHMNDALLDPVQWQTGFGLLYGHVRGITAPLFFSISGWAFAVATLPRFEQHLRYGPPVKKRLERVLTLFFWGSVLTIPWWAKDFPFLEDEQLWYPFVTFGVLHCIAAAMLVAQLLLPIARTPKRFIGFSLALVVLAVAVAPFVHLWASDLSPFTRGALHAGSFAGGFPLLPWAAYFWLGAAAGMITSLRQWGPAKVAQLLAVVCVVTVGASYAVEPSARRWLASQFWVTSPSLFLLRVGSASGVLAVLAVLSLSAAKLARLIKLPAEHALTFYVGHMLMIWGVPLVTGLYHRLGPTLSFTQTAGMTALCIASLWVLVRVNQRVRAQLRTAEVTLEAKTSEYRSS